MSGGFDPIDVGTVTRADGGNPTPTLYGDPISAGSSDGTIPAVRAVNTDTRGGTIGNAIEASGAVIIDGPLTVRGSLNAMQLYVEESDPYAAITHLQTAISDQLAEINKQLDGVRRYLIDTSGKPPYTTAYFDPPA